MQIDYIDSPYPPLGSGVPRSDSALTGKPHLTTIIRYIGDKLGLLKYANAWDLDLAGDLGFTWERVLELAYGDRLGTRIGEIELDGIVGSPDGVGPDPDDKSVLALDEYKLTWVSSNNNPSEVWKWMVQCKSYCRMLGLDTAIMHILYLMGNYRGSGPIYRVARIRYSQQDLVKNWMMIVNHKEEAINNG